MRTAIYARISTNKQDTTNQLIQLREFCERQSWTVVTEFCDVVSGSGKKDERISNG
jgi:DNA invertase Pin-like site-specific DNA recombinase